MKVHFEKGIPGFEEYKTYEITKVKDNDRFKIMISTEESSIGFIAISPFGIKDDYEIDLNNETIKDLQVENPMDVLVLNLITLGKTLEKSTVNLKAPIVINVKNNKGKQMILQDDKYKIKEPLV